MEHLRGVLKVRVVKGRNLVAKDINTSDPYVVIKMGDQKLKTKVVKKTLNPDWNEDLTFAVKDPAHRIELTVFDKDRFSADDPMGRAELDVKAFMESAQLLHRGAAPEMVADRIYPGRSNCLVEESKIYVGRGGELVQDAVLRLYGVASGEVEIRLQWVELQGSWF